MNFGYSYYFIVLVTAFIITFTLVAIHSYFLLTTKFTIKQFLKRQYYLFKKILHVPNDIYSWLYSIFFDNTKDFEDKYSKYNSAYYKRRKQQQYYSYTKFHQNTKFNNIKPEEDDLYEQNISNNSFTTSPDYNQFFLDSSYEILGIPYNSDFTDVVRPTYIKLINQYHEDKITKHNKKYHKELFNEISKRINAAYDKLKREHKH